MTFEIPTVLEWLLTSFFGAVFFKLIDLFIARRTERQKRLEEKVKIVTDYVEGYAELNSYYNNFNNYRVTRGATKVYITGMKPDPFEEEAIRAVNGVDVASLIYQKYTVLKAQSSNVIDQAIDIDPSGDLEKLLKNFHICYLQVYKLWRKRTDAQDDELLALAQRFHEAITEAINARRQVRENLKKFVA